MSSDYLKKVEEWRECFVFWPFFQPSLHDSVLFYFFKCIYLFNKYLLKT